MPDRYSCFEELAANERPGTDFRIRLVDRHTETVILAPHGGFIEPKTSEIAEAIAEPDISFYAFESLKNAPHGHYHITSHRFDEPKAIELLGRSRTALAIHGRRNNGPDSVWLGGLHTGLRDAIGKSLRSAGFKTEVNQELPGQNEANVCNRGSSGKGVQLEISRNLRHQLAADAELLKYFCRAVRFSI